MLIETNTERPATGGQSPPGGPPKPPENKERFLSIFEGLLKLANKIWDHWNDLFG